jgi:hypothetical protein
LNRSSQKEVLGTVCLPFTNLRNTLLMRTLSCWNPDYGHHLIYGWNNKALNTHS